MAELSPAAQAVLDAAHDVIPDTSAGEVRAIAAALRAAATTQKTYADTAVGVTSAVVLVDELLAIATELENLQ